jgi:adenylate cyclase
VLLSDTLFDVGAEMPREASNEKEDATTRSDSDPQLPLLPPTRARKRHYAARARREQRVINIIAALASMVCVITAATQLFTVREYDIAIVLFLAAAVSAAVPLLHRFGKLVPTLTMTFTAFVALSAVTWSVGTDAGLHLFFLVAATIIVMVLGIEHLVLASMLVALGTALVIALDFAVPDITGKQPLWAINTGFVIAAIATSVMVVAAVAFALREIERAEDAMEEEFERSESLLTNMLPKAIAARLKNPSTRLIADKFDDASVLFADVAGYTERASQTTPVDLVEFLNRLYTEIDRIVERHGLEKIKTIGDCYMVVSGVPQRRPDHLEALARLALELRDTVGGMTDNAGRTVSLRVGLSVGPLVAGVVGTRRLFYDVWGDTVNVASRMESTGVPGRIQLPQEAYERLKDEFVLEERGEVTIKGKGVMRTWLLIGQRPGAHQAPSAELPASSLSAEGLYMPVSNSCSQVQPARYETS